MHRRDAVATLIALSAAPFSLMAQLQRYARVGVIATLPPANPGAAPSWKALYAELKARGWEEGRNLVVEARYSEGRAERDSALAAELVTAAVDVIIASNSQAVDAARKATRTIPIVMTNVSHAVEAGYVASLARPGGNITGVTNQLSDLMAKHVEFLRAIRLDMKRFGVLWSPDNKGSALAFKDMQEVARALGIALMSLPVSAPADVGTALAAAQREGVQALHVHPTPAISVSFKEIQNWAVQQRVMTISGSAAFTRGGFLLSYGADFADLWRISATYVDRILRGANPAELPVEQPTKFELILNLRTARAIDVTIPQILRLRADEVIQ